jgi:hypothetical protein
MLKELPAKKRTAKELLNCSENVGKAEVFGLKP